MPITMSGNKVRVATPEGDAARASKPNVLNGKTLDQRVQYIQDNVTTLAAAKLVLVELVKHVTYLEAEVARNQARITEGKQPNDRRRFVTPPQP